MAAKHVGFRRAHKARKKSSLRVKRRVRLRRHKIKGSYR